MVTGEELRTIKLGNTRSISSGGGLKYANSLAVCRNDPSLIKTSNNTYT